MKNGVIIINKEEGLTSQAVVNRTKRLLGAARTSAYYAIAPFVGTFLSLIIFRDMPRYSYFIALTLMIVGAWLCSSDDPIFRKKG